MPKNALWQAIELEPAISIKNCRDASQPGRHLRIYLDISFGGWFFFKEYCAKGGIKNKA